VTEKPPSAAWNNFWRYVITGIGSFGIGGGAVALTQRDASEALATGRSLVPKVASLEGAVTANTPRLDRVITIQDSNTKRIGDIETSIGVLKQQNDEQTKALDELKRDVRETNANVLELLRRTPK
jgi:hypothetical protein